MPDKISGSFSVTTKVSATGVLPPRAGNVSAVLVRHGAPVDSGQVVARLATDADPDAVADLEHALRDWTPLTLPSLSARPGLGEIKLAYNALLTRQQNRVRQRARTVRTARALDANARDRQVFLQNRVDATERAQAEVELSLKLTREELREAVKLYQKRAIDYVVDYLPIRQRYSQLQTDSIRLEAELQEFNAELVNVDRAYITQSDGDQKISAREAIELSTALAELRNAIANWRRTNEVVATASGKVSFPRGDSPAGMVALVDQPLLTILPPDLNTTTGLVAYLSLSAADRATLGAEGAELGLPVRLKFKDYPFQEWGFVEGRVTAVRPGVNPDEQYEIRADLPRGLVTSAGRTIPFTPGMDGTGEVFTKQLTLWEMVF